MNLIYRSFLSLLAGLLLLSCGSSYDLSNESSQPELSGIPLNNFLILVLYPDDDIEARVALEKSTTDHLKSKGLKATAGYTLIPSYANLESEAMNIIEAMDRSGTENLLMVNPISYSKYSDTDNYNAATTYRALGMETSEWLTNVSALIESSQASKFVMGVSLWNKAEDKFVWEGTYDLKVPGGYELDTAKLYSAEFIDRVLKDIESK